MSRLTSFLIAGITILSGSFAAVPAQASVPVVTLMKGKTQYVEMSLEPGRYLIKIAATGDGAKASFSMYETSGKLIKQSSQLPPELQSPNSDQGAVFEISRARAVHFGIRMDTCKTLCAAGLITVKASSGTIDVIEPPFKVLSARPSYSQSQSPQPTVAQKQDQPKVLVDNSRPSKCNFIRDEKLRDQCSRLQISKVTSDRKDLSDSFSIDFFFKGVLVTYIVPIKLISTDESNGKTFRTYPVAGRIVTALGQKPRSFTGDEGTCVIATDYSEVACGSPEFLYVYTR